MTIETKKTGPKPISLKVNPKLRTMQQFHYNAVFPEDPVIFEDVKPDNHRIKTGQCE